MSSSHAAHAQDDPSSRNQHQTNPDSPTIGPLRINKPPEPWSSHPSAPAGTYRYPSSQLQSTSPPPSAPIPYPNGRAGALTPQSEAGPSRGSTPAEHGQAGSSFAYAPASLDTSSDRQPYEVPRAPQSSEHDLAERDDGLFQRLPAHLRPQHGPALANGASSGHGSSSHAQQTYYPPPAAAGRAGLIIPNPGGVNRLASTASVSTTKAARGSPPPPETPASDYPPAGGIEARYAAAGIAGPATLTSLQAQSIAAQQRQAQYQQYTGSQETTPTTAYHPTSSPAQSSTMNPKRWTATEAPGSGPLGGEPLIYHGNSELSNSDAQSVHSVAHSSASGSTARPESELEQDMQRLQVADEPPPAYSSVSGPSSGFPAEKRRPTVITTGAAAAAAAPPSQPSQIGSAPPAHETHPAFANDPRPGQELRPSIASPTPSHVSHVSHATSAGQAGPSQASSPAPSRTSPPPLPEGWIAHLDPSSGQYYYIHLASQSTQWEFPKGPTPLSLNEPPLSPTGTLVNPFTSPTASTFSGKPLASPSLMPPRESIMSSMSAISSPTAAGFTSLPPSHGVETYRIAPTNGVYFGPYLRYTNMDVDNGIWYGSILIVTDATHPPTIHLHQTADLSPNPRQLKANPIYTHQRRWTFYRYDIDLRMEDDHEARWTYAVTSHLGCTRYEFLVAGRYETSWRFIAHSNNDFALNVNATERAKLGGESYMWKDIMQKNTEVGGFHAQLGLGNQICADRIWKEIPSLKQWTATKGKDIRKNAQWTVQHEEDVTHAYFHYYTSHFDQPNLREAFAQIPHVLTLDDHDIFDGFGSYPEYMQFSHMFRGIGRIGVLMYLLFQHHTTLDILSHANNDFDLFTITGTGWHFLKYLGPAVVVVGPDCRSERNQHQVMAGPTYQGLFPKVAVLPPHVQHCIWMLPVPIVYPRLESAEQFAQTMATGKKAVTGAFNALGKVSGSVAGIVGAKAIVGEGFSSVKKAVGKSGLMSNVLSPFGELDIMDELRDQWTHESKDLERTYLIRTLQGISFNKALRMTFFSGATNCAGAGLLHDPSASQSHKTMYQVITSAVVNAPPSGYVLRMLHPNAHSSANRPIYVPTNGQRSGAVHNMKQSDTKEDMLEIFGTDVTGQPREMKRLMGRRNYVAVVAYDPEMVQNAYQGMPPKENGHAAPQLSLAVDYFVQSDTTGAYVPVSSTVKYGPLTIPALAPGK